MLKYGAVPATRLARALRGQLPISWSIFEFEDIAPYYTVTGCKLSLADYTEPNNGNYWVAFANYSAGRWEWQAVPDPNTLLGDPATVDIALPGGGKLTLGAKPMALGRAGHGFGITGTMS